MSLYNFVIRTKRFLVEKYQEPENWILISDDTIEELGKIAGLTNDIAFKGDEVKRFDLLMYSLQVALLRGEKRYEELQKQLIKISEALEMLFSVPAGKQHLDFILDFIRRRLHSHVNLVERDKHKILYSSFEDEFG